MDAGTGVRKAGVLAFVGASMIVSACQRPAPGAPASSEPSPLADYAPPPEITSAVRTPAGATALSGKARPGASVRLASPDGSAILGVVSASGVWTMPVPAAQQPRLYSLSEDLAGRPVRAKGYIAVIPFPGPAAVLLRPGGAAEALTGPRPELRLSGVDFDGSGAGVAGGVAAPGDTVRLQLDGAEAGVGRADIRGVFTVPLAQTLRPGPHVLTAASVRAQARATFDAGPAAPLVRPPFAASRSRAAWRIDWVTPGGGMQTTILFDPMENAG